MIKVADEVWLATSLLHREHPEREDFSVIEIVERAMKEGVAGAYRPGLQIHASTHCVASKPPNPARHCMLSETRRGRRRLFRLGDKLHRNRKGGKTHPDPENLPQKYRYLIDWYEHNYANGNGHKVGGLAQRGCLADLVRFAGTISQDDLTKMKTAIEQDCERIDLDEWRTAAGH